MISLPAIPTDRPTICLRLRVLRWAAELQGLAASAFIPACRISAELPPSSPWFMAVYLQSPPPPPNLQQMGSSYLLREKKKVPNRLNKYNKQEVIMGKLLVIAIYWSPEATGVWCVPVVYQVWHWSCVWDEPGCVKFPSYLNYFFCLGVCGQLWSVLGVVMVPNMDLQKKPVLSRVPFVWFMFINSTIVKTFLQLSCSTGLSP